jgi:hypothetical protein
VHAAPDEVLPSIPVLAGKKQLLLSKLGADGISDDGMMPNLSYT